MINFLKNKLKTIDRKKTFKYLRIYEEILAFFYQDNLNKLAQIYRTDKWGTHFYTQHYHNHFKNIRFEKLNILEIGVGGFEDPLKGGNSLRMWKRYFPNSNIYSLDIHDKSFHQEKRIKIFQGSQVDFQFLDKVVSNMGEIDIIIDDGSHINEHVINTFEYLFPKLKTNGIYAIEDTQTSYFEEYGGDYKNLKNSKTMMNFFKDLIDSINSKEIKDKTMNYYDLNITQMHFYHNLIFVYKSENTEPSNLLV
jgi:demethylmacrocin O-methyltransferase